MCSIGGVGGYNKVGCFYKINFYVMIVLVICPVQS